MDAEQWLLVVLIIFAVSVIAMLPFATIWSLNIIFGLQIGYSFKTWVAMAWLITVIHGLRYGKGNSANNE